MHDADDDDPSLVQDVENHVVPEGLPPDAKVFVTRNKRKSAWRLTQLTRLLAQIPDEGSRSRRIITRNVVADLLQIALRLIREDDPHASPRVRPIWA